MQEEAATERQTRRKGTDADTGRHRERQAETDTDKDRETYRDRYIQRNRNIQTE